MASADKDKEKPGNVTDGIPNADVKFQIHSAYFDMMYRRGAGKNDNGTDVLTWCKTSSDVNYDDGTWWTLQPSRVADRYLVVQADTKHRLNDIGGGQLVSITSETNQDDDQIWRIYFCSDDDKAKGIFNIKNYPDNNRLTLDHNSPHIGIADGRGYDAHFFRFNFQPESFVVPGSVHFNLDAGLPVQQTPKLAAQQTFANNTSVEQTQTFRTMYTKTKTHHFEYTGGFTVTTEMEMSFTAGIPLVESADMSYKIGAETSHTWTSADDTSETTEEEYTFPIVVGPGKTITAQLMIYEGTGEVPYEMTIGFKNSDSTMKSYGKWHGVNCLRLERNLIEN